MDLFWKRARYIFFNVCNNEVYLYMNWEMWEQRYYHSEYVGPNEWTAFMFEWSFDIDIDTFYSVCLHHYYNDADIYYVYCSVCKSVLTTMNQNGTMRYTMNISK